jgi:CRP/FNR family transcriptional regulator
MLTADQLRQYPLFADLSDGELSALASCVTKRVFAKDAYLFHPGNPVLNLYLLESGMARAFFINSRGREFTLTLVYPYSVIGMPLIRDNQTRMLGASAVTPLVTLILAQADLLRIAQQSPALTRNLSNLIDTNMRALMAHVRSLVTLSVNGRLANVFLYLGRGNRDEIDLPLSQADIAGWIGASRGHLNRAMTHLQKSGLIRAEGQKIVILDRAGLERVPEEAIPEEL